MLQALGISVAISAALGWFLWQSIEANGTLKADQERLRTEITNLQEDNATLMVSKEADQGRLNTLTAEYNALDRELSQREAELERWKEKLGGDIIGRPAVVARGASMATRRMMRDMCEAQGGTPEDCASTNQRLTTGTGP